METPTFRKNSQISQKSFYALMRWFLRRIDTNLYRKNVMETLFLHVTGVSGLVCVHSWVGLCDWRGRMNDMFFGMHC